MTEGEGGAEEKGGKRETERRERGKGRMVGGRGVGEKREDHIKEGTKNPFSPQKDSNRPNVSTLICERPCAYVNVQKHSHVRCVSIRPTPLYTHVYIQIHTRIHIQSLAIPLSVYPLPLCIGKRE